MCPAMDAVLKTHRRFSSVLAALAFYVFDGFLSQNPPGRANIRLEGRSRGAQFQAVEYRQDCQAGTSLADFPT